MTRKSHSNEPFSRMSSGRVAVALAVVLVMGCVGSLEAQVCQDCVRYIDSSYSLVTIDASNLSLEIAFDIVACEDDDGAALVVPVSIIRNAGNAPSVSSVTYDPDGDGTAPAVALEWQEGASTSSEPDAPPILRDNRRKRVEIWLIAGPDVSSGEGGLVTVTFPSGATAEVIGGAIQACGVNQTTPVINRGTSNNQTVSTFAVVAPQTADGALLIDTIALDGNLTTSAAYGYMVTSWNDSTGSSVFNLRAASGRISCTDGATFFGDVQSTRYNFSASSYYAFGALTLNPESTTAVSFDAASAVVDGPERGASLRWRTAHEADTLGFNVLRSVDGELVQVNNGLIAGSALAFAGVRVEAGYVYGWLDPEGRAGDQYWIEEVEISGRRALHGPLVADVGQVEIGPRVSSTVVELARLAQGGAAATRVVRDNEMGDATKGTRATERFNPWLATQWRIASAPALRVVVDHDGWYRLSYERMVAAGLDVGSIEAESLQLFRNGVQQATRLIGAEDGVLGPGDSIEFFGRVTETSYSGVSVYWLAADVAPRRLEMKRDYQTSLGAAEMAVFRETVEVKDRSVYVAGVLNGEVENFFGDVLISDPVVGTIETPGAVRMSRDVILQVAAQGFTTSPRRLLVEVNGVFVGELAFEGNEWREASLRVPAESIVDGSNSVTLTPDGEGITLVDRLGLVYNRRAEAVADQLDMVLSMTATKPFDVVGFSSADLRAADVSIPDRPIEILPSIRAEGGEFTATVMPVSGVWPDGEKQRRLMVFAGDAVSEPAEVVLDTPSSWNAGKGRADLVVIGHDSLLGAVRPLVAHRESQGIAVAVVDVADLYDEFSYGHKDPGAIRAFLAHVAARWKTPPSYVLLVGDGTYDPRDYLGYGGDLVPTRWVESGVYETASDSWFADVTGDTLPDFAIGRLPAASHAEASLFVNKILAFESGGLGLSPAMLIADEPELANFDLINDRLVETIGDFAAVDRLSGVLLDAAAMRTAVLDAINAGFPLVHYSGHGGVDSWRRGVLTGTDADGLTNVAAPSVFTMMNCLNGVFQEPLLDSLGEALLRAPGGAVAVWASTGTTDSAAQEVMMRSFYEHIAEAPGQVRIGDAIRSATAATDDAGVRATWVLLGDPCLQVR